MHVVAIVEAPPGAPADPEALARALGAGVTALDVRLALSATLPSVLFRTPSRERADAAARALASVGLVAVAVDLADVVPIERMVPIHRVALDATALRADTLGPTLAYEAIGAIVRVAAETSIWRTTREKELPSMHGRGVIVEVTHTRAERTVEQALFVFARGDGAPWVLRAGEARYLSLGPALKRTAIENFLVTLALLRERAPHAGYDERFVAQPLIRHAEARVRDNDPVSPQLSDVGVEVRVHLLARALGWGQTVAPQRSQR